MITLYILLLVYILSALLFPPVAYVCLDAMTKEEQAMIEQQIQAHGISTNQGIEITRWIPVLNTFSTLYFLYLFIRIKISK